MWMPKWCLREIERRDRAHAEERDRLVKTICLLAGRPVEPTELDAFNVQLERDVAAREDQRERMRKQEERAAREAADDLVDFDQLPDDEVI